MREPGREAVAGIVAHSALFGRDAEGVGDPPRGPFVVRREGNADVTIIENGVVFAIGLLDLVEALGDEEGAHTIAGHEGETRFEEVEPARSEEHTSELQSLMRISYAVFRLTKTNK